MSKYVGLLISLLLVGLLMAWYLRGDAPAPSPTPALETAPAAGLRAEPTRPAQTAPGQQLERVRAKVKDLERDEAQRLDRAMEATESP